MSPVNTDELELALMLARQRVLKIQTKLHRWARDDLDRRFDDLFNLVADPAKFPSGMKALADYLHANGFKLGIYSCAGTLTCGGYPGSWGNEFQDARTFASWGIDYLKYDWCSSGTANPQDAYKRIRDGIHAAGPVFRAGLRQLAHLGLGVQRALGHGALRDGAGDLDEGIVEGVGARRAVGRGLGGDPCSAQGHGRSAQQGTKRPIRRIQAHG